MNMQSRMNVDFFLLLLYNFKAQFSVGQGGCPSGKAVSFPRRWGRHAGPSTAQAAMQTESFFQGSQ